MSEFGDRTFTIEDEPQNFAFDTTVSRGSKVTYLPSSLKPIDQLTETQFAVRWCKLDLIQSVSSKLQEITDWFEEHEINVAWFHGPWNLLFEDRQFELSERDAVLFKLRWL